MQLWVFVHITPHAKKHPGEEILQIQSQLNHSQIIFCEVKLLHMLAERHTHTLHGGKDFLPDALANVLSGTKSSREIDEVVKSFSASLPLQALDEKILASQGQLGKFYLSRESIDIYQISQVLTQTGQQNGVNVFKVIEDSSLGDFSLSHQPLGGESLPPLSQSEFFCRLQNGLMRGGSTGFSLVRKTLSLVRTYAGMWKLHKFTVTATMQKLQLLSGVVCASLMQKLHKV